MSTTEATGAIGFAAIDEASSGDNEIVAALAGSKIRLLSFVVVASAGVSAKWVDESADLSGAMLLAASTPVEAAPSAWGVTETLTGESLSLNLSGDVQCSGFCTYQYVA